MQVNRTFRADIQNLPLVIDFLESFLQKSGVRSQDSLDLQLAVDEAFTNIASYAYGPEGGDVDICIDVFKSEITITITDTGKAFDPLSIDPPDIKMGVDERQIGGLGIYLIRQVTDDVTYLRRDGKNMLIINKRKGI
ncbi:MAG: ATP-binding protein [Methanocalculus sp. MSAO_Arc2]|uniref:ATP-binding protein n=1 Tax=Methanocalculus sp. MSAO_Arc2 TaxID=2293855 RepID=UPI000FF39877|nr:MAG: ATP-binding protein [Methanocalculus sp. MSAO_Arc2]